MRIAQVITTLQRGGAEWQLVRVLGALDLSRHQVTAISLLGDATLEADLKAMGVEVVQLGMRKGVPDPRALWRLVRELRHFRPDVVQTWLYAADLMGSLAARLAGVRKVIWTLQTGNDVTGAELGRLGLLCRAALRRLAPWLPRAVVCSSQATAAFHRGLGYPAERMVFIPNGANTANFHADAQARAAVREELAVGADVLLVGMAARFHPQKDYRNLAATAGLVHQRRPDVRFVLYGADVDESNAELTGWLDEFGARDCCHLLGLRTDIARLDAAMDIGILSSSFFETFPLAISEMMACEVPCAVTDVGDLAYMVADTGRVAPPRDPQALAEAVLALAELAPEQRAALGRAARQRVLDHFEIGTTARAYEEVWEQVARDGGRR